ncbi:MAG: DMT family transporter [Bacteroidaceae bacterium]|nr:DMT family transporter [Bacteroidaceae bacterium]
MNYLIAILVVCVWGTTFVSSKVLLNAGMTPAEIFLIRFIMAYVCLCAVSHKRLWAKDWKDELTFLGLGIMGGSLYFLTENEALVYSTTANVSILVSTCPLLTALIVSIFYKSERMTGRQIAGSFIAFIGVVLVILNGQLILELNPRGDILALTASLTWALYSLFMKRIMGKYRSDYITRKVFGYGIITIIPYFFIFEPFDVSTKTLTEPTIFCNLLFLGLVASTGGYLVWSWAMKQLGAVKATNCIYIQPLVTMIAGIVILSEPITPMGIGGIIVTTIGMVLALRNKKK